ncbi:RimJ/RimL family protein N-acetyltransferase [Pullulanibacillus pueri]|uniref:Acetyltransferase n=2 Tax=Pullulanibacillus pueri TaxID=1437324 RepID=A0A8J2ZZU4_9BACL|nr:RimJ/RimL family protein N-acetyltransferase [Pullulanibacillus pueri]GGH87435.1 acetyltransferase [Pullulanibacillus pueri]
MEDVDFYASLWGNSEVVRYIGAGIPKTPPEAKAHLQERVLPRYKNGVGLFAMVYKPENKLIGHAGIIPQEVEGDIEMEIGYWLMPEYWGKGLAKEAAMAFRDYGFNELGLDRMISLINPNNPASIFVARKNGMRYERTVHFLTSTALVYAIQKEEFLEMKQ